MANRNEIEKPQANYKWLRGGLIISQISNILESHMGLETGTYIDDLVATNPVSGDQLAQADDHLRLIKSFIKASFPNITGAMTATHTILNGLDARVTAVEGDYVVNSGDTLTGSYDASAATWSNLGAVTTADINGGSIDGTIIGAAAAAAGTFAALVGTTFSATGAATFGSTVLLNADPTLALQAATKQYVDDATAFAPFFDGLKVTIDPTDPLKDLGISAGSTTDGTRSKVLTLGSNYIKQMDASWAVGTNAGMLDGSESVAGTPDASTWYHIHLIMRSDTGVVDVLASESATSPTLPTNYDYSALIWSVWMDATPNLRVFSTDGSGKCLWDTPTIDFNAGITASARDLKAIGVPLGFKCWYTGILLADGVTATDGVYVSDPDNTDIDPDVLLAPLTVLIASGGASAACEISGFTDASSQLGIRSIQNGEVYVFSTRSFVHPRGMW